MNSAVRPELPTASVGSSQAPTAAVDNSAPSAIRPGSTYKSGKVVQTNGATSLGKGVVEFNGLRIDRAICRYIRLAAGQRPIAREGPRLLVSAPVALFQKSPST